MVESWKYGILEYRKVEKPQDLALRAAYINRGLRVASPTARSPEGAEHPTHG